MLRLASAGHVGQLSGQPIGAHHSLAFDFHLAPRFDAEDAKLAQYVGRVFAYVDLHGLSVGLHARGSVHLASGRRVCQERELAR